MERTADLIFREEYSKLVAIYCHKYGVGHLELIEDAIQDAFQKAVTLWPQKTPDNPKGWIYTVSKNRLLDKIKALRQNETTDGIPDIPYEEMNPYEINDNKLRMMFACCHPAINISDQLLLSLKFLCGFGNRQIARVLLKSHSAIERASSRAKQKFQSAVSSLEVPEIHELSERLDAVLKVVYLQFTEGYKTTEGEGLVNKDLSIDAIKLAELVAGFKELENPKVNAILALMYFQASRLETRVDENGKVLTLEKQDRSKWNYHYIMQGDIYLGRCAVGEEVSTYHIEAAVASYHAAAKNYDDTNWAAIFDLYTRAIELSASPFYVLNRAIALSKLVPAKECLEYVLKVEASLPDSQYTHVFIGDLFKEVQKGDKAASYYQKALTLTSNQSEKDFIKRKLDALFVN